MFTLMSEKSTHLCNADLRLLSHPFNLLAEKLLAPMIQRTVTDPRLAYDLAQRLPAALGEPNRLEFELQGVRLLLLGHTPVAIGRVSQPFPTQNRAGHYRGTRLSVLRSSDAFWTLPLQGQDLV